MSKIAGEFNAEIMGTINSTTYQAWLNSPLTKALKRSFEQSITDPENQPSQYGTVTLEMYEQVEEKLAASLFREAKLREALEKSRSVFDQYVQLHLNKNPPDGEKAARNAFHRGICDEALRDEVTK